MADRIEGEQTEHNDHLDDGSGGFLLSGRQRRNGRKVNDQEDWSLAGFVVDVHKSGKQAGMRPGHQGNFAARYIDNYCLRQE